MNLTATDEPPQPPKNSPSDMRQLIESSTIGFMFTHGSSFTECRKSMITVNPPDNSAGSITITPTQNISTTIDKFQSAESDTRIVIQRADDAPDNKAMTWSRRVYDIPELLDFIALQCNWPSKTSLAKVTHYARAIVQRIIQARVRFFLSPFLQDSTEIIKLFFDQLRTTRAGIAGSFPWAVMDECTRQNSGRPLHNLNLIVPCGLLNLWRWKEFLFRFGYKSIIVTESRSSYRTETMRTLVLESPNNAITITESKTSSIMPVLVCAPVRSMFNILTSSRLYSLYPSLLDERLSLTCLPPIDRGMNARLKRKGIKLIWSTSDMKRACGEACPSLWRRVRGLPGVAIANWGGFPGTRDAVPVKTELGDADYKWRIGYACHNKDCPNYAPLSYLSDFHSSRLR